MTESFKYVFTHKPHKMPNLTLALPEELRKRMKEHDYIKWSAIAREAIQAKVTELDEVEKIFKKSKLTLKDVEELSHKVKKSAYHKFKKKWRLS